jgi:hypothetical protein
MQRRNFIQRLALSAALATVGLTAASQTFAADTIKVVVLHSLSGTMAISETVLKDVALMTIDEINAKGGLLGKKLEPVVVDPASNWPLFAEAARRLSRRTRSLRCSAAGPPYRRSRCCRCLGNERRALISCSTKARALKECVLRAPRRQQAIPAVST